MGMEPKQPIDFTVTLCAPAPQPAPILIIKPNIKSFSKQSHQLENAVLTYKIECISCNGQFDN